jgi:AraC family transcriptional regulator
MDSSEKDTRVLRTDATFDAPFPLGGKEAALRSRGFDAEMPNAPATAGAMPGVHFRPANMARRPVASWRGLSGEIVDIVEHKPFESEYCGPFHLLIAYDGVVRRHGESFLEGVRRSTLRDLRQKLTFVPAGLRFLEWQEPRAPGRATYFYIEANGPFIGPDVDCTRAELAPRLFFDSAALCQTVHKLRALIEAGSSACPIYAEALGVVLVHELFSLDRARPSAEPPPRGGLAGWQRRAVDQYLGEHMAERVPLAKLAELTHLSHSHFIRAFKQSFGMTPSRFHIGRRIDRAKMLLAEPALPVTTIALDVGFSETSSFTTAFRKFTGRSPTQYRRSLL